MTVEFSAGDWPKKLNLGCGFDHRDGYLNVDLNEFHDPDLVADVTDLAMLPSSYYDEIVACDVLEHLPRHMTEASLSEWNRLLTTGGVLKLQIPSLFDLVDLFRRPENLVPERQQLMMQCLFGTQAYTGDTHFTSFTRPLLEFQLREEGFEVSDWRLRDEWLFEVEARKVGPSSFAVEWSAHADLLSNHDVPSFIEAAYRKLLGRSPDPSGASYFREALGTGRTDRRQVIRSLSESEEALGRST